MARKLHYRVVELKVRRYADAILVEAWLLIHGQGMSIRFVIESPASLGSKLADHCAMAYEKVTGSSLPDNVA